MAAPNDRSVKAAAALLTVVGCTFAPGPVAGPDGAADARPPEPPCAQGITTAGSIGAGGHTCVPRMDGRVMCFGKNDAGQLGDGTTRDRTVPGPTEANDMVALAASPSHTCGHTNDGALYCWGRNLEGQLGLGAPTDHEATPMLVPVGAEAGAPAAGERHTCVLVAGNDVRCWGDGAEGQLGDGLGTTSYAPVVVASLPPVVQIGAGQAHACVRTNNGQVWCWGRGAQGQLGDSNTAQRNAPVQAVGIAAASHLAVGWNHACAIDGVTVLCWGQNASGQLGTDDLSPHASPQAVTFDPVITPEALVAGEAHTCVLTSAQEIICWGANDDGQLGHDGAVGAQPAPGAPVVEGGWLDLAAGGAQTCARRAEDTSVWCWGDGDSGQLGDGGVADRRIPSRAYGICVPL